jgi:hypothetical protein
LYCLRATLSTLEESCPSFQAMLFSMLGQPYSMPLELSNH